MTQRNKLQHSQARDQAIDRYMQALDQGDIDTVEAILNQAAYDPELDRLLHEVHIALYVEDGLDTFVTNAEQVRSLARQHLRSAFVDEAEVEAMIERPLTVGRDIRSGLSPTQITAVWRKTYSIDGPTFAFEPC